MAKREPTAKRSKAAEDLEAAFAAEGITVRDLIRTLNEVRTEAQRYSTKTGEPVGADHQARGKAACDLLELLGLPEKKPGAGAPAAPKSMAEALSADAGSIRYAPGASPQLCRRCETPLLPGQEIKDYAGLCHASCEYKGCPPPHSTRTNDEPPNDTAAYESDPLE